MIEFLKEFVQRFPTLPGFQGWFVSAEGEALCTQDFLHEEFRQVYPECSNILFLTPGLLFFCQRDGVFDLDRVPDWFAVPATELGEEILAAARAVCDLEIIGDDLQDAYMELLDQWWRVERSCRGEATRGVIFAKVKAKGTEFDTHRVQETAARACFLALLLRFGSHGDTTEQVAGPDLSLPKDDDGEYSSEESGEGRAFS